LQSYFIKRKILLTISAIVLVLAIFFLILPLIRPFEEIKSLFTYSEKYCGIFYKYFEDKYEKVGE
jgi:hypothetical protein